MSFYEKYLKYKNKYLSLVKLEKDIYFQEDSITKYKLNNNLIGGNPRPIKLFFVRHGTGIHQWAAEKKNDTYDALEWENPCYRDSLLVEEGKVEATKLKPYFEENQINLIYTSGLRRTVQTMCHALNVDQIKTKKIPIFSTDNLNEKKSVGKLNQELPIPPNCPFDKETFMKYIQNNKYTKDIFELFNCEDINEGNRCTLDSDDSMERRIDEWFNKMVINLKRNESINNVGIFSHGIIIKDVIVSYLMKRFPSIDIFIRIFKTEKIILLKEYLEIQRQELIAKGIPQDKIYTKLYNCDIIIFEFDLNIL